MLHAYIFILIPPFAKYTKCGQITARKSEIYYNIIKMNLISLIIYNIAFLI